jgi:peptide/nickel transport system permease protein
MTTRPRLVVSLALLGGIHAVVLFAGFFAPYNFAAQDRNEPYTPPTRLRFVDRSGRFHLHPFVYAAAGLEHPPTEGGESRLYPVRFFVLGTNYRIAGIFNSRTHLFGVNAPARIFLMGTDAYGRDQFSRFLYGGQVSLLAGLLAATVSLVLGTIAGSIAGFYGGWVDEIVMRGGELFLALPWLYLLFGARALLPLDIAEWQVLLLLVLVLGMLGWARPARLVRGVILSARERKFVVAARGFGASDFYLLTRHILPQAYPVLLTQMAVLVPQYVLAEVTLTFLGLGTSEPMPSWGTLLASLEQYRVLRSYWWMFLPALLLIPVFAAFHSAADAVQERSESAAL